MAIIVNTKTWQDIVDVDDDKAQEICDQKNVVASAEIWVVDSL